MTADSIQFLERPQAGTILPLTTGEIHLWLASYDEIADRGLQASYREMLSRAEREQEPRFYFPRDRQRYLVTRAMVRTVLSRYADVDPSEWQFATNAYGRPYAVNREAAEASLQFNLSHTHSLIVLAVTRGRALGVDVENVRARQVPMDIADRYFAPSEVAALARLPREAQQERFFEYWTFKEAYIKARGMGLSLPLDGFSFHCPDGRGVGLQIDASLADDASRWELWQFRPDPQYLVALCSQRLGIRPPRITVRRVVPLCSEMPQTLELTRASEYLQGES